MNDSGAANMALQERIIAHFHESLDLKARTLEDLAPHIEQAATLIFASIVNDGKVICCGNGGSAALGQYFSTMLLNRYQQERPGLPAISLSDNCATMSAIATDVSFNDVYSKQIRALGHAGDVLLLLSACQRNNNLVQAIQSAHDRQMTVIALTGASNQDISSLMTAEDLEISIDSEAPAHVNEIHLITLHLLGDLLEYQLFGGIETL